MCCREERGALGKIAWPCDFHVGALGGGEGNRSPVLEILEAKYVKIGELSVEELRAECIHPNFLENPAASKVLLRRVMALLAGRSTILAFFVLDITSFNTAGKQTILAFFHLVAPTVTY